MFHIIVIPKLNDGIGAGLKYDVQLLAAGNRGGQQIGLGAFSTYAAAKTFVETIFKATISWAVLSSDGYLGTTAAFTA